MTPREPAILTTVPPPDDKAEDVQRKVNAAAAAARREAEVNAAARHTELAAKIAELEAELVKRPTLSLADERSPEEWNQLFEISMTESEYRQWAEQNHRRTLRQWMASDQRWPKAGR